MERWILTFRTGRRAGTVTVSAPSVVCAIRDVCETMELPHRAILEARKVRK